ncbi:putative glutathione-specific gamma-glutamylcyclotransferase 2 [Gigantopelta aegis]|uniref:putative glutathione-specific gamma-glutamylcyclotransferase 2 n=1 Tax=Gigantopelta aegis TaxID=1735272 RepID=UPI001B88DB15|nr:putative glutathione-specific gamma-glutamylcyclotransferase 2 [Gigantopelta aegis]
MNCDKLVDELLKKNPTIWVFGYGSLLWKPNFEHKSRRVGHIRGFVRRFWQGNTTYRGTPNEPGRVANLVESEGGIVWGVAFQVTGKEQVTKALDHLTNRECTNGGYTSLVTTFYPRDKNNCVPVLVFTATEDNPCYLGDADLPQMSKQIVTAKGHAGSNVEYVTKIADYVRNHIPEDNDEHLFDLDTKVRDDLKTKRLCSHLLMLHTSRH